jgi:MOSC domain-containing protein YiiM
MTTDDLPVWDAELVHIITSRGHDYWGKKGQGRLQHGYELREEVRAVEQMGLEGDRYFGERPGGKAQVTFINADVIDQVKADFKLPNLPPGVFRRNLVVRGVELSEWLGKPFVFQGVSFEGSQECKPCEWMDRSIAPGARLFLKQPFYGGLRARVLSTGTLRLGRH